MSNQKATQRGVEQMSFLDNVSTISTERVFRYPGSKGIASKHFARIIPSNVSEVVSPFFGGGSFELRLTGMGIKVHGSDLFEPIVNLWNHILNNNNNLSVRCKEILFSSNREQLKLYQNPYRFEKLGKFDQAAYTWLFQCLSWNGMAFQSGLRNYVLRDGEAYLKGYKNDKMTFFDRLRSFQNNLVKVDLRDYREQLAHFPNTFAYLDPPYPEVGNLYGDSPEFQNNFNHVELRDILKRRESSWILSYNNTKTIRDLYSDDHFVIMDQWWNQGTNSNSGPKEVVIIPNNYKFF